jgi:hypothetical protein
VSVVLVSRGGVSSAGGDDNDGNVNRMEDCTVGPILLTFV